MKNNILFISDSSLTNPILHSQGLPLLKTISNSKYNCFLITFEDSRVLKKKYSSYIKALSEISTLIQVHSLNLLSTKKYVPNWLKIYLMGFIKSIKLIIKYDIRIVHSRSFIPTTIAITLKMFLPRLKILYDNRGVFVEEGIYKGYWNENSFKCKMLRRLEKVLFNKADAVVVVSNKFKDHLLNKFNIEDSDLISKITVIPNKTTIQNDYEQFTGNTLSADKKVVGIYSGSTSKWQQIPELMKLFIHGVENFDNIYFKIFTYEDTHILFNHLKNYNSAKDRIEILNLNLPDVKQNLSQGSFGILIREQHLLNRVSCPLKFAEYLASGLPVMVSQDVGDMEEIISSNQVGVVIEHSDYESALKDMLILLKDVNVKNRCLEVAQKQFNLKDAIIQYEQIYNKLDISN